MKQILSQKDLDNVLNSAKNEIITNTISIIKNKNMYLVNENRLAELLREEQKLTLLENGGVDNWEWYDDSLNPDNGVIDGDITYGEIMRMSDDEIIEKYL